MIDGTIDQIINCTIWFMYSGYTYSISSILLTFFFTTSIHVTQMETSEGGLTHKGDRRPEEHRIEPSNVVHVRALHRSIIEADLWDSLAVWGKIVNIFMMSQNIKVSRVVDAVVG